MEYIGNPRSKIKTAIVGKGITFDSGGQNLKPTGHIETMRLDMAGAATVLGVMKALTTSKAPFNVIGVIGAAHNAIGSKAYFPGDIYTSYTGKTVEILSTDAEGRLVLADAVAYCEKNYKPTEIIDFATLTGGILYALGELTAGLFSNDDSLAGQLFESGEVTGERLWRFPLYKEYCDSLKSDIADLRNLSKFKKGYASSITGAAFIKEFITSTPWAHIDIAGTAFNEGACRGEIPQFGTGFGVRLVAHYLSSRNK
jgi:leucyl aminopeptidase